MSLTFEELTGREKNYLIEYEGYLIHQDILESFKILQAAAKKEIGADLKIISSFRDYERQKMIWNRKALGKRPILDDDGNQIEMKNLSSKELISAILRFSALPGASRHHWGTDIDIYDASKIKKENLQLTPQECLPGGPCYRLHSWLDDYLDSNLDLGFFRPYNQDLGGISVEKWHLSYAPLSNLIDENYTIDILKRSLEADFIEKKSEILKNLEFIFTQFIKNITYPPKY